MRSFAPVSIAASLALLAAGSSLLSQVQTATAAGSSLVRPHLVAQGRGFCLTANLPIISGEMHYTRIPRAYWRDRLHKARLMGLNTITT